MSISKITVDLRQRTFTIEVPDAQIDNVLSRIESLFEKEGETLQDAAPDSDASPLPLSGNAAPSAQPNDTQNTPNDNNTRKRPRQGAKPKSWRLIDFPLSSEQRQDIRTFFATKSPKSQNDTVAVVAFKLKEHLKKDSFTGDEIHSGLKIVQKPTPKNLVAVFGNMRAAGISDYRDNALFVTSQTEDHVTFHIVSSKKNEK